ncbi:MAG: hypothetical protein P4M02_11575 [Clostridia bacterium]|nr:hypothetical protein [Clostridia bacterium]
MSLIQCNSNCSYQLDGYCRLDKAAQVTNQTGKDGGCLHFVEKQPQTPEKHLENGGMGQMQG